MLAGSLSSIVLRRLPWCSAAAGWYIGTTQVSPTLLRLAVDPADRRAREEARHRVAAQRDDHLRLDDVDLLRRASCEQAPISSGSGSRLPGGRHLTTLAMNTSRALEADAGQQLLEELPGGADERAALLVLVVAGRLADEHDLGVDRPFARHGARARRAKRAGAAGVDRQR